MSSPIAYIEEQLVLRESLAQSVKMMENHLAEQGSPRFGILSGGIDVTEQRIAEIKLQIGEIDTRTERLKSGNPYSA